MPRNRTVRVAVLGSSVQRAASGYSSTRSGAVKRRIVFVVLVLASLVLITISFRSSALDSAQGYGASLLRPFEVGASRVARPFRDAASYANGLFDAKSENEKLKDELDHWRQLAIALQAAAQDNRMFREQLDYQDSSLFPEDYAFVHARVLTSPPAPYDRTITIAAGSNEGIAMQNAVITPDGLVGQVTKVSPNVSKVMLISDPESAVSAVDARHLATGGLLEHGSGTDSVVLNRVSKDRKIESGDTIITAGSPGAPLLPSVYPRGVLIGTVTSVSRFDTDLFTQVQVEPFVDLNSLQSVIVLIPKPLPAPAP